MLQEKHRGLPLTTYGFLVACEVAEGTSTDSISERLAESLGFLEGVSQIEVNLLGELETVGEDVS